jgi:hypothetical protein
VVVLDRGTGDGAPTRLGSGCMLMACSHIGHNCQVGDRVIVLAGPWLDHCNRQIDHCLVGAGRELAALAKRRNVITQGIVGPARLAFALRASAERLRPGVGCDRTCFNRLEKASQFTAAWFEA